MDPPSNVPRSGEDLSRAFRNLPPGTLSGLDALCDHNYWLSIMRQAEIDISNEDIFRFRFSEISKTASNRLAFLAGTGEHGSFNLRYLIQQLVEQCADMHKYTRKLEKYVVKLQRRVEELESHQPRNDGNGGNRHHDREQRLPPPQAQQHGGGSLTSGVTSGGGNGRSGSTLPHHPLAYGHPHPQLAGLIGAPGQQPTQSLAVSKRPRSPPAGSMEAAGSSAATEHDEE